MRFTKIVPNRMATFSCIPIRSGDEAASNKLENKFTGFFTVTVNRRRNNCLCHKNPNYDTPYQNQVNFPYV